MSTNGPSPCGTAPANKIPCGAGLLRQSPPMPDRSHGSTGLVPGPGKERRCTKGIDSGDLARIDENCAFSLTGSGGRRPRAAGTREPPGGAGKNCGQESARRSASARSILAVPTSQQSAGPTRLDRPPRVSRQFHVKHCQRTATCVSGSGWHRAASSAPDPPPPRRRMQRFDGGVGVTIACIETCHLHNDSWPM